MNCHHAGDGPTAVHCNRCPCCSNCPAHGNYACEICYPRVPLLP